MWRNHGECVRVGKSDFSDPVCKCNRCCCSCHCSCILGSGCELFTRDGASAIGEGQGRKIRKSRDWEFLGRKEPTGNEMDGACVSGSRKQWLNRIEGRLQPGGVLVKHAAPSANARKVYRKMGEWYPCGIYFTPQTSMQKALRKVLSSARSI